jgi:hypothetical protein
MPPTSDDALRDLNIERVRRVLERALLAMQRPLPEDYDARREYRAGMLGTMESTLYYVALYLGWYELADELAAAADAWWRPAIEPDAEPAEGSVEPASISKEA